MSGWRSSSSGRDASVGVGSAEGSCEKKRGRLLWDKASANILAHVAIYTRHNKNYQKNKRYRVEQM